MSQKDTSTKKNPITWIQFTVSEQEYDDIQRIKANSGNSRMLKQDYYRELIKKGLASEQEKL